MHHPIRASVATKGQEVAKLEVAILGLGRIGRLHAQTIACTLPDVELAIVVDAREQVARQVAESTGAARWATDPADAIDDPSVGAVIIATPDTTHTTLARMAAVAGKHIFCEKPLGLDLIEIQSLLLDVRRTRVKLQVGFQRRFDSGYVRAKQLINEGGIGETRLVCSRTRDARMTREMDELRDWSGLFLNVAVHDFDVIRYLSGSEVEELYVKAGALVQPSVAALGHVDTAAAVMGLENGAMAILDLTSESVYGYDTRAEVLGSKGAVRIDLEHQTPMLQLSEEGARHDYPYGYLDRFSAAYKEEIGAFIGCILGGEEPRVTGEDGLVATRLALAAADSVATGQPVRPSEL